MPSVRRKPDGRAIAGDDDAEGALDWVKRLPSTMSADAGRKRVRLSHARTEALTRQVLQQENHLELPA